jgi:hypothetical protein
MVFSLFFPFFRKLYFPCFPRFYKEKRGETQNTGNTLAFSAFPLMREIQGKYGKYRTVFEVLIAPYEPGEATRGEAKHEN